jgi:hypothetical protein
VVMWDDLPTTGVTLLQHGLQRALADLGVPIVRRWRWPGAFELCRAVGKLGVVRPCVSPRGRRSFTVLNWASDTRALPDTIWREIVPWIIDCWGPYFPAWERLLRRHRIRTAFFSARDAAEHFARAIPGLQTRWIPEACDPTLYHPGKPLAVRPIRVLELGRKWRWLHERITEPLARAGATHRFSSDGVPTPIFASVDDLYRGMGDAAIMVCVPKSITHPEGAGGVETMTQRFLEAIGSRCLCVGRAPRELTDLFGFNPLVEIDERDPAGHLLDLLGRIDEHQALVDRARARLPEIATFPLRAREILAALGSGLRRDGDDPARPLTLPTSTPRPISLASP